MNRIDLNNIKYITKKICIPRPVASSNLALIKKIISKYISKISGLIVTEQKFSRIINNNEYTFSNIIANNKNAKLTKLNQKKIILSAHIDSIYNDLQFEGAIDSATAIALIIEIVFRLIKIDPYYPISIVFFDGEEAIDGKWSSNNTLSGSTYMANHHIDRNDSNLLVYVIDLIGGSIDKNPIHPFAINRPNLYINYELSNINNRLYPNHIIFSKKISSKVIQDDHIPFANNNIPYIHLIPDVFPAQHHTMDDTYNNVNWSYIEIFGNVLFNYLIGNKN